MTLEDYGQLGVQLKYIESWRTKLNFVQKSKLKPYKIPKWHCFEQLKKKKTRRRVVW
jgi:hypothetical protein